MTQAAQRQRRWWLLGPMLAAAAWLALFGDKSPSSGSGEVVVVQERPRPAAVAAGGDASAREARKAQGSLQPLIPRKQLLAIGAARSAGRRDLFSDRSWTPIAKPPKALPPPPPMAPVLPFAYLGKKLEAGKWEVYLASGEKTFVVHEGSTVDGVYRVETIAPPNITLTYLPLGQSQTLGIGESR